MTGLGAATLGESGGRVMAPRIRAVYPTARLAGPACTVECTPGDNLAVHVAAATAAPGSVLVVTVGPERERGYWGEVLTTLAETRGIAGLVIDGGVRDVTALEAHGFPVFSALVALRGAAKVAPGRIGAPVSVGDVEVRAGDWVVGDADGVTVVPEESLAGVVDAARARAAAEQRVFADLRAGHTTVELFGLDPTRVERFD